VALTVVHEGHIAGEHSDDIAVVGVLALAGEYVIGLAVAILHIGMGLLIPDIILSATVNCSLKTC